jgi:hypothetical protein
VVWGFCGGDNVVQPRENSTAVDPTACYLKVVSNATTPLSPLQPKKGFFDPKLFDVKIGLFPETQKLKIVDAMHLVLTPVPTGGGGVFV